MVIYKVSLSNIDYSNILVLFQVFQSNTGSYMVSSTYFYLIIGSCLLTVILFQVINNNTY